MKTTDDPESYDLRTVEARLDLLERFDRAWRRSSSPRLVDYLPSGGGEETALDEATRRALLVALVKIDLEYRWRKSRGSGSTDPEDRPRLELYVAQFPDLGPIEGLSAGLIAEEYRVRLQWGDRPSHEEYLARFP